MKKMILLVAAFGFLVSCSKEIVEANYLPGKWNLIKTELYESGALQAVNLVEEISTVYYFSACETAHSNLCDMYIEEDGDQQYYSYSYDDASGFLQLNGSSNFQVAEISSSTLLLVREYDTYQSKYLFTKGD
jgi:hypothetical protein